MLTSSDVFWVSFGFWSPPGDTPFALSPGFLLKGMTEKLGSR